MGLIKTLHLKTAAVIFGSALLFTSCGGGGSSSGGGVMFVRTCSLGCSNGQQGAQVSCAVSQIFQNQELGVLFSEPVDISSVNSSTFQLINPDNSDVPLGSFFLDPANPNRVIFRPALSLDPVTGQPEFGLDPLTTYLVTIPGVMQGDSPPYIRSASGQVNQSRMQCTITTTNEAVDLVPGPPQATVTVDLDDGMGGIVPEQPADGAVDVSQNSLVTIEFGDIMNSATLVNTFDGTAPLIRVEKDEDGNLLTIGDRSALPGTYSLIVDEIQLKTFVIFTPAGGLPSGGSGLLPRKIVVTLPPGIQDLSGNGLLNFGEVTFTPFVLVFPAITLPDADGENFDDTANEDNSRSSAKWGNGQVALRFTSGGSGRLGDLRVRNNETVILNTDSQLFPLVDQVSNNFTGQEHDIMSNLIPGVDYDPANEAAWPTITVTDGVFEFASLRIEGGGRVVFTGDNPAQIQVRGEAFVGGVLDVSGTSPGEHDSRLQFGQAGGAGGAAAGAGGAGGVRYDQEINYVAGEGGTPSRFLDLVCRGALGAPDCLPCLGPLGMLGDPNICMDSDFPGMFTELLLDGSPGEGVGFAMAGTLGGAPGGQHWPPLFPLRANPATATNFRDLDYNRVFTPVFGFDLNGVVIEQQPLPVLGGGGTSCINLQVGGTGGGGVYGRSSDISEPHGFFGEPGMFMGAPPVLVSTGPPAEFLLDQAMNGSLLEANVPPGTSPGDQLSIGLDGITRRLSPHQGNLRGGAGGGGAGSSLFGTTSSQVSGVCTSTFISIYRDNSGAGGGGGGGAVQLHSGTRVTVTGSIDASGGQGGGAILAMDMDTSSAAPGGGGSGGAILIQAPVIDLAPVAGAINVAGGAGGVSVPGGTSGNSMLASIGGIGGGGLVRLEEKTGLLDPLVEAMKLLPFDPLIPDSNDILSIGNFGAPRVRPESMSGSVSCWMRPTGAFGSLEFLEDDPLNPDPALQFGWNMKLRIDTMPGAGTVIQEEPYRGPNGILAGSFEDAFGNMLNHGLPTSTGSPVAVRFQGAQLADFGASLCDLDINGTNQDIVAGSLTPWVNHPAELNGFLKSPDMIRFIVVFDRDIDLATLDMVQGATDLLIRVQPN